MCCQGAQASMQSDKDMIDNLVREEDGEGAWNWLVSWTLSCSVPQRRSWLFCFPNIECDILHLQGGFEQINEFLADSINEVAWLVLS